MEMTSPLTLSRSKGHHVVPAFAGTSPLVNTVIPAPAPESRSWGRWIPVFTGMTGYSLSAPPYPFLPKQPIW